MCISADQKCELHTFKMVQDLFPPGGRAFRSRREVTR